MKAVMDRFVDRVVLLPNECWEWSGGKSGGYGRIKVAGKNTNAHRVAYELFIGPIPDGLTLDHLCRNRACVNPTHLDPVTDRENVRRGASFSAVNARKSHCIKGHRLESGSDNRRRCRICARAQVKAYKQRKRVMRPA